MSTELVEVTQAVAEFDRVAAGLAELQSKYKGVVYEVATTKGMKEAIEARRAVREPRIEVEIETKFDALRGIMKVRAA